MNAMGLKYDHEPVSVFRHFDAFAAINPVVKAPTFVTDEGIMLIDSTLILAHLDRMVAPERQLSPTTIEAHARAQRVVGWRSPPARRPCSWSMRPSCARRRSSTTGGGSACAASSPPRIELLEVGDRRRVRPGCSATGRLQADISSAVAWRFTNGELPGVVAAEAHPKLARLSERAEALPEFVKAPYE